MSTTRAVLRQRLAEAFGGWFSYTTSTIGAAAGASAIAISAEDQFPKDSLLNGFWSVLPTGPTNGSGSYEARRINTYTAATGTLVPYRNYSAQVASGQTIEVMTTDPTLIHNAINRAMEKAYHILYLPVRDETLVVDNLLANPDFEGTYTGGAHPSWTNVGSDGSVTADTTRVMHGTQSAKLISVAAVRQITQAPTVNVAELSSKTARLRLWVWCSTANTARLRLDWDGANFTNGDYHPGDSSWHLLEASGSVPSTATQVKAIGEVAATGGTAYFDAGWLSCGPVYRYTIPTSIIGLDYVSMQADERDEAGSYTSIGQATRVIEGRRLRLEGRGLLTRPTSDTDAVEVDGARVDLLVAYAAEWLASQLSMNQEGVLERRERYTKDAAYWHGEAERLAHIPGVRMAPLGAERLRGWHIDQDATARYLVLNSTRG